MTPRSCRCGRAFAPGWSGINGECRDCAGEAIVSTSDLLGWCSGCGSLCRKWDGRTVCALCGDRMHPPELDDDRDDIGSPYPCALERAEG